MKRYLHSCILFVMLLSLFGCALLPSNCVCIPSPGLQDWDVNIYRNYDLVRSNSRCIKLCKRSGESGWKTMIPNFFVTGFSIRDPYILAEGIQTADIFLSDEERESRVISFCALDTRNDSVIGPFDTADELMKELDLSGIDWTPVTDPPDLPNVHY